MLLHYGKNLLWTWGSATQRRYLYSLSVKGCVCLCNNIVLVLMLLANRSVQSGTMSCASFLLLRTASECTEWNGDTYPNGESWNRDVCTRCTCVRGHDICESFACRPGPCPRGYHHVHVPGRCCPVCKQRGKLCEDCTSNYFKYFSRNNFVL